MFNDIPILLHVIILLTLIATGSGLWIGLTGRRDVDSDVICCLSVCGVIGAAISTVAMAAVAANATNQQSAVNCCEVLGLALSLCLFFGSLGIGLAIGPARAE
jgi:hypothetical protein